MALYPTHPDCETCQQYGECVCMDDFDEAELREAMQPLLDRLDDFIMMQILCGPIEGKPN